MLNLCRLLEKKGKVCCVVFLGLLFYADFPGLSSSKLNGPVISKQTRSISSFIPSLWLSNMACRFPLKVSWHFEGIQQ